MIFAKNLIQILIVKIIMKIRKFLLKINLDGKNNQNTFHKNYHN